MQKVLVLGGTRFVGRAIVDAALGQGVTVTLFHRGITNPGLYPGVETLIGDRTGDLAVLTDRRWDVVVDTAAYQPDDVAHAVRALSGRVDRYVLISSVSVYADQSVPQDEDGAVLALRAGLGPAEDYGARKAACERIVLDAFDDRAFVPRPGLIVGPHDQTDRFAYWPRRLGPSLAARGPRVLAPGDPTDPLQYIDVRDLAGWTAATWRTGTGGVFNAVGDPFEFRALVDTCLRVTGGVAAPSWVDGDRLLAAGVDPWMGVPLWIGDPACAAANRINNTRAKAAGLRTRPLAETIRDVLSWDTARGGPAADTEGLTAAQECDLLARTER